jgi:hypothetical protein
MPPIADYRTPDLLAKQSFNLLRLQWYAAYRVTAVPEDVRVIRTTELYRRKGFGFSVRR